LADSAYVAALRMLGRRELSEAQLRQRLARRGHESGDIDTAVVRLKADRSLDDARVAGAIVRTETSIRRRGRLRVRRQLQAAGIDADVAAEALDAGFAEIDVDALLDAALARRLPADRPIADDREFQRLYRFLMVQGFDSDLILAVLRRRRRRGNAEGS
jgi:regulatory protein